MTLIVDDLTVLNQTLQRLVLKAFAIDLLAMFNFTEDATMTLQDPTVENFCEVTSGNIIAKQNVGKLPLIILSR